MPGADAAPVRHRILPGAARGSRRAASPHPRVPEQGGRPHPSSGSRGAWIPPCAPHFPPSCESHRPVPESLHLKGHRALKLVARGGRGGLAPCRHLFASRFPPCHLHRPVPRGGVLPVGGTAHSLARATSPVGQPRPRGGTDGERAPHPTEGGSSPRQAGATPPRGGDPTEGRRVTASRGGGFVNLFFSLILKKICNDFPGNKLLLYSCQQAEVRERALGLLQTLWHRLRHHKSHRAQGAATAQGRGPPVPQHKGCAGHDESFPGASACSQVCFGGGPPSLPPSLPGMGPTAMGHPAMKQAAPGRQPVPHSLSSPSGKGIFRPISPGSRLRVPGFDSRPSPVIMWLPGKEGSRRNWLLCLAPLQEVFLLGGTQVRTGWEAFPDSSPHTCVRPWGGAGTQDPPHHPGTGAAIPSAHSPKLSASAQKMRGPLCMRFRGKELLCSHSTK